MAVTLTKKFWTNLIIFVVACVALGLSIWAFATACKKDGFGDQPSSSLLYFDANCSFSTNKQCSYNKDAKNYECPGDTTLIPKKTNNCRVASSYYADTINLIRGPQGAVLTNGYIECKTGESWGIQPNKITCPLS